MNVCVIGAGYVGLTTSAVLASQGHNVQCVEKDQEKVERLKSGHVPIYEPGLDAMVQSNVNNKQLIFVPEMREAVKQSEIIFIAVGTPSLEDGRTNLRYIEQVLQELATIITSYKVIVSKSTVPIGTNEWMEKKLLQEGLKQGQFDLISNPEFLREGTAIADMLSPDKIVLGVKDASNVSLMKQLYHFSPAPYIITSFNGAELIKYASNAFLAVKISFMNEMALLSEHFDINVQDISEGLKTDPRIGPLFLQAGLGYGGSCLPKDVSSLIKQGEEVGYVPQLVETAQRVNEQMVEVYIDKIKQILVDPKHKKVAVWGASFKPNTDDTRHSRAIQLIKRLVELKSHVQVYDPVVKLEWNEVTEYNDLYQAVHGVDLLIVATEWEEFTKADWNLVKEKMDGSMIIDARNVLKCSDLEKYELQLVGIGRG
ncbi:UDP-glucose dehydrogenase family protein [Halalkalibacter hemicellulosilyticus]|nr:UDP-glucose/GDP-mannose dehydrogenase family protein [Halalkalibacter hemicellulosilyticus]